MCAELNKIEIFDCALQKNLPFLLSLLFYLLSGNGNFREERKKKGKKRKVQKETAIFDKKIAVSFLAPPVGLEPTTTRLTAECSTD